jgi:hypothetical protein
VEGFASAGRRMQSLLVMKQSALLAFLLISPQILTGLIRATLPHISCFLTHRLDFCFFSGYIVSGIY